MALVGIIALSLAASHCAHLLAAMGNCCNVLSPKRGDLTEPRPAAHRSKPNPLPRTLCDNPAEAVFPSGARNLALSVFKAVRDSSSLAAPRNDTQTEVITQTPQGRGWTAIPRVRDAGRVRGWFREKTPHPPSSVGHLLPKGEGCDRARRCGRPRSS